MAYAAQVKTSNPSGSQLRYIEVDTYGHDVGDWKDVTEDLKKKGLTSVGTFYFTKADQKYNKYQHSPFPDNLSTTADDE